MTDLEQLGGVTRLGSLMTVFVERMASDFVIGFRFEGKDLERIAFHEAELAAIHLSAQHGGSYKGERHHYGGRSLPAVHAPMRLSRGQFERRLSVLATVLRDNAVAEDIITRWIAHDRLLEPVIASNDHCAPKIARLDR